MSRQMASDIVGYGTLDLHSKLAHHQRPRVVETLEYDHVRRVSAPIESASASSSDGSDISEAEKDKYRAEGARKMSEATAQVLAVVGAIKQYVPCRDHDACDGTVF
jgi:hypothetical protein